MFPYAGGVGMAGSRFISVVLLSFLFAIPCVEASDESPKALKLVRIISPESGEISSNAVGIDAHDGVFYWLQKSTGIHRFDNSGEPLGAVEMPDPSDLMRYYQMDVSERGILLVGERVRLITAVSDESWRNYDLAAAYFLGDGYLYVKSKLGDPESDFLTVVDGEFAPVKMLEIDPLGIESNRDYDAILYVEQAGGKLYLISHFRPLLFIHDLESGATKEIEISCHYSQLEWLLNRDYETLRPPHLQGITQVVRGMSIAGDRLYVCCEGRRLLKVFVYDLEGEYLERFVFDMQHAEINGMIVVSVLDMKVLPDGDIPAFFMLSISGKNSAVAMLRPE